MFLRFIAEIPDEMTGSRQLIELRRGTGILDPVAVGAYHLTIIDMGLMRCKTILGRAGTLFLDFLHPRPKRRGLSRKIQIKKEPLVIQAKNP